MKDHHTNKSSEVLLIHPPVVRPCEPPPGLARLAGALSRAGIPHTLLDANIQGLRWLCGITPGATDTWTRRAAGRAARSLDLLTDPGTYQVPERYRQAVSALNRVLAMNGREQGIHVSLSDYQDKALSPARSGDLATAFDKPETNLFYPWFEKRLGETLSKGAALVVGFSVNFLSQALCAFAMAGYLKRLAPETKVILGGGLVTSWLQRPGWKSPFDGMIDHLVSGPGEGPFMEILGIEPTGDFPLPDYRQVAPLPYLSPGLVLPYSASNGCYWRRCAFCPEKAEGSRYRPLPAPRAASQLKALCEKHNPALIHLTDNAVSPALLKALAADPPGAPWYGFVRITPHLADPDFCKALGHAGCVMLQIGLESGSQRVLDAFGKGVRLETAQKALSAMYEAGIATYVYLLFGTPWEKRADALETLDLTARFSREITFLNLAVFNLPAHSRESDALETHSFYQGDLSLYRGFSHPDGWQRKDVRQFLDRRFKRHPAVAHIVRNDPPVFTSSHAAFFRGPGPPRPQCS